MMKHLSSAKFRFILSLLIICLTVGVFLKYSKSASSQQSEPSDQKQVGLIARQSAPITSRAAAFAISPAVRDLPEVKHPGRPVPPEILEKAEARELREEGREKNIFNTERVKQIVPGAGAGVLPFIDEALSPVFPSVVPTPAVSFDGLSSADNTAVLGTTFAPPDTVGDVGPNHYVQMDNTLVRIYNKSGTPLVAPFRLSSITNVAGGPCANTNDGDPIVVYDPIADRWILSQFCVGPVPGHQIFAVSRTPDPTGAYYVYDFANPSGDFFDYPHIGVWPDGYYMSVNQFNQAGTAFLGAGAFAYDRVKMLSGDPTASYIYFNELGSICPTCGGQLPTDLDGTQTPPAGMGNLFMEFRADELGDPADALRIFEFKPNYATPASSTFLQVGAGDLVLAAFDARSPASRSAIEQPGTTIGLDAIADRLMHRLAYRNLGTSASPVNSFVLNFSVNVGGVAPTSAATYQTGIRWVELRRAGAAGAMSVNQQGTQSTGPGNPAGGTNLWMGSVVQDKDGDIVLGYSTSGSTDLTDFPSIKYAGRLATDPLGTLAQGENIGFAGTGFQSGAGNRWGDYSAASVDPADECSFWYTQEYRLLANNASAFNWNTRIIGGFKFPSCTAPARGTISGTITSCSTNLPIANAVVTSPTGFVAVTNASGQYTIINVPAGSTAVSAAKSGGFSTATNNSVTVINGGTATVNLCLAPIASVSANTPNVTTGNNLIEPNECNTLNIPLTNNGAAAATAVSSTLSTSTPGVTITAANSAYADIAAGGGTQTNTTPFQVSTSNAVACGTSINLTMTVTYSGGPSPTTFNLSLPVGQSANPNYTFISATGTIPAGGTLVAGSQADDSSVPVALPGGFASTVYGTAVTSLSASTNGALTVNGSAATSFTNTALPAAFGLTPTLFPYWDDLDSRTTSAPDAGIFTNTTGSAPNRQFIIEWRTTHFGDTATASNTKFAVVLTEGSDVIRYIYALTGVGANLNGAGATIGAQAASSGTQFTQFSFNTASLSAGLQLTGARAAGICAPGSGSCASAVVKSRADFDGDGRTDISVYRPSEGNWYLNRSTAGFGVVKYGGAAGDVLIPGDYDGDGKADFAIWRPSDNPALADFYILNSNGFTINGYSHGLTTDIPVVGDFDGDGKNDIVVFRPSTGVWYLFETTTQTTRSAQFGLNGDIPMAFDNDGDGKANLAVFRPSSNTWYIAKPTGTPAQNFDAVQFGLAGDILVPANYDGDNKVDIAVFRPSNGTWYIRRSSDGGVTYVQFGQSGDIPVPGDYDGDGRDDVAVYRNESGNGTWYLNRSTSGFAAQVFGLSTDTPIPARYHP